MGRLQQCQKGSTAATSAGLAGAFSPTRDSPVEVTPVTCIKKCSKLGSDELAFRSAARDIDRCLTWEGRIRRKQRKTFEAFLTHPNQRARKDAREIQAGIEKERQEWLEQEGWDEELMEEWVAQNEVGLESREEPPPESYPIEFDDDDIPF